MLRILYIVIFANLFFPSELSAGSINVAAECPSYRDGHTTVLKDLFKSCNALFIGGFILPAPYLVKRNEIYMRKPAVHS